MYTYKTTEIPSKPGCWSYLLVEIFKDDIKIGEYQRNYSAMYDTFVPFTQNGKDYALYSQDYTSTRVMTLPDCKALCGEERLMNGFCPTGFYVPTTEYIGEDWGEGNIVGPNGHFGFVCGCVWGDDSSWKIQFLDLSKIEQGILTRDDRFGYIELFDKLELKDSISVEPFTQKEYDENQVRIDIACRKWYYTGIEAKAANW